MLGYIGPAFPGTPDPMPRWFGAIGTASKAVFARFHGAGVPGSMYHYTSAAALIPILQNNELWLSDATFLNDRTEVDHGVGVAAARIGALLGQETYADVVAMFSATLTALETDPRPPVYVACFSWAKDDLGQWRGYGGSAGTPVSIELANTPLMFGYTDAGFSEVRYETAEQEWIFDQILESYRASYAADLLDPRPFERSKPLTNAEEAEICSRKLYHDLWRYIVACKSPVFKSEREVRFVYTAHDFSNGSGSWFPGHPTPMFRERGGRIIPYLSSAKLDMPGFERNTSVPKLPVKSIRIGPSPEQALTARGVRRLLDACGFEDADVIVSDTPFRG